MKKSKLQNDWDVTSLVLLTDAEFYQSNHRIPLPKSKFQKSTT